MSPGGFYQREKIQKTYDLSSIISKRRNELICNVLVKCNAMEAAGTGFERISAPGFPELFCAFLKGECGNEKGRPQRSHMLLCKALPDSIMQCIIFFRKNSLISGKSHKASDRMDRGEPDERKSLHSGRDSGNRNPYC